MYKSFYTFFTSTALIFIFLMATQTSVDAQMWVRNDTNCTVYVKVGQTTGGVCSVCNPSATTMLLPGASFLTPPSAACGPEQWLGLKFYTAGLGSVGVSYNPLAPCGADVIANCGGAPINVAWFFGGGGPAGPVRVLIQ